MSISRSIVFSTAALASLLVISSAPLVHADVAACTVKAVGTKNGAGASNSRFVIHTDGTASADVQVTGTNCAVPVTISAWQAPDALKGRPYSAQKLFGHTTQTFNEGMHTISVKLPDCYYQVDLLRGTNPTAADGSPVYDTAVLMGSLHGGTQVCGGDKTPPPPPTELPKTGSGANIFVLGALTAVAGYAVALARKARA